MESSPSSSSSSPFSVILCPSLGVHYGSPFLSSLFSSLSLRFPSLSVSISPFSLPILCCVKMSFSQNQKYFVFWNEEIFIKNIENQHKGDKDGDKDMGSLFSPATMASFFSSSSSSSSPSPSIILIITGVHSLIQSHKLHSQSQSQSRPSSLPLPLLPPPLHSLLSLSSFCSSQWIFSRGNLRFKFFFSLLESKDFFFLSTENILKFHFHSNHKGRETLLDITKNHKTLFQKGERDIIEQASDSVSMSVSASVPLTASGTDDDCFLIWNNFLRLIKGVSEDKSIGITKRFPSFQSIMEAYDKCQSTYERINMVAEIPTHSQTEDKNIDTHIIMDMDMDTKMSLPMVKSKERKRPPPSDVMSFPPQKMRKPQREKGNENSREQEQDHPNGKSPSPSPSHMKIFTIGEAVSRRIHDAIYLGKS